MAIQLILQKSADGGRDYFLNHPVLRNHLSLYSKVRQSFSPADRIFYLKAPGRLNLIGEHTDYNMGPVLPCAIDKEIVFAVRPHQSPLITAINCDDKFSPIEFTIQQEITPYEAGHWGNYIKAGVNGIINYLRLSGKHEKLQGFDAIVSSTLPQAAGVSSSSALVVAAALTFVFVNNLDLNKREVAEICAGAEHFVGTAGGGMDQAASLLGRSNGFLYMEFNPLKVKEIDAPQDIQLILFNSLVQAEKSGRARKEYNRRVLECKMAVDLFNHFFEQEMPGHYTETAYIGEIKAETFDIDQAELDKKVNVFIESLADSYSLTEFLSETGFSETTLNQRYASVLKSGDQVVEPMDGFRIKPRFKHVYNECRRVTETIICLQSNDLEGLGQLINASHNSLSKDYEVSLPEVDQLVDSIRRNGALGARIMGAGFGGMVLALSRKPNTNELIEKTKEAYYHKNPADFKNDYIFPCLTADGAGQLLLKPQ